VSTDPTDTTATSAQGAGEAHDSGAIRSAGEATQGQPSEEELRAAYEAEMSRISSTDMILQATVSLLNIGGYRLGLVPGAGGAEQPAGQERDLEQVRDAIDGARALLPILERRSPEEMRPLREALSQLQMAYAREAGASALADQGGQAPPAGKPDTPAAQEGSAQGKPDGPGPAESSGRLWVPGR
jgi:hypothetical protein